MNTVQALAVFRADASTTIGGGHVMRSLSLADGLSEQGWRCVFACRPQTTDTIAALQHSVHDLIILQAENEADEIMKKLEGRADWLIVDHYNRDAVFHRACRRWADSILVIDELADRQYDCDILLDQTVDRDVDDYRGLVPSSCRFLPGPLYALLRPEFAAQRDASLARRQEGSGINKVLVSFGAVDAHNLSGLTVEALQQAGCEAEIDIILGGAAVHGDALRDCIARSSCRISLHEQVDDMATRMAAADLAIGAAGMTTWERCCLGLPALVIVDADNQLLNAARLHALGAGISLGQAGEVDSSMIAEAYNNMHSDIGALGQMASVAAGICDGRGVDRVRAELLH